MSEIKKCCRHCCYFKNDACTLEPFKDCNDSDGTLYTFIDDYLRKAIRKTLNRSDFSFTLFGQTAAKDKNALIDEIAEDIENNAETLADEFYAHVRESNIAVTDPDSFFCKNYK